MEFAHEVAATQKEVAATLNRISALIKKPEQEDIYAFAYRYFSDLVRFKAYLDVYRGKVGWVRVQRHGDLSGKIRKTTRLPLA
jgi:hypothetical protein